MKIEKRIVIYPYGPFKAVTLGVSDVDTYEEADKQLADEINKKYLILLPDDDKEKLRQTNKYIKRK